MSPMKILAAAGLSLLVLLALGLVYNLETRDPLPAQARRILAQDPRFSRVTVTIAFGDIVVLEGQTRTVMDSWDARNLVWTAWQGTPWPSGVLNHIRADEPPHDAQSFFNQQGVIPKIVR